MAEIDIAQIKSMLTAAKEARGPDPRLVVPSRNQSSATLRDMQKLLPLLEKAGLDVGALEKIAKEDEAQEDRKPTADDVKRHAWMKKTLIKNMKARAGGRRAAVSARVAPLDQPVTEIIQPFLIWAQPIGILTQSNMAADDNWASAYLKTNTAGTDYVSFLYLWNNPNDFAVGIEVDTSLAFIGYCKVMAGGWGGTSVAHIFAHMDIYQPEATVSTPIIDVLDLHANSLFSSSSNDSPVNSIVDISNDQVAVSPGETVLLEVYASFMFASIDGTFHESYALFDFDSEFQIANPNMTITSTPVILF
jgi:hypothetical protein